MAKKKKLSLNSFKVTNFATSLDNKTANLVKGGVTVVGPLCSVEVCGDTLICSATHCPDPCPDTGGGQPTIWPCRSVDKGCYPDTNKPCTGIGTVCTCEPWCYG